MSNQFTKEDLKRFQAEPLEDKFQRTLAKVAEWYSRWNDEVYVSFSGGKDSTVLADICAKWCSVRNIPLTLVFVNTGLEYPEIQKHVKFYAQWLRDEHGITVNLEILRPKMRFDEVIKKYGYPIISKDIAMTIHYAKQNNAEWAWKRLNGINAKNETPSEYRANRYGKYKPLTQVDFNCSNWCCLVMKEKPLHEIEKTKKPIIGILAEESERRTDAWLKTGCNAFDGNKPMSKPMSFWTEQDVLQYIKRYNIPIASVYGDVVYTDDPEQMSLDDFGFDCGRKLCTTGCDRTGCIFCAFGAHLDKPGNGRFERLKETHPKQYAYCIGGGEYINGVWQPSREGLGMGHVFDELNKIYGDDFIKY